MTDQQQLRCTMPINYRLLALGECGIIGGTPSERLQYATKLRRLGIATFTDYRQRKRDKAFKAASDANYWGKGGVYDLDDPQDRAWLDRADLATVGV